MLQTSRYKDILYFSIIDPAYEDGAGGADRFGEVRRLYFSSQERQKGKETGAQCGYQYDLRTGKPMKWKKLRAGLCVERSEPMEGGGYRIWRISEPPSGYHLLPQQ